MIKLEITCSMCGKELNRDIYLEKTEEIDEEKLKKRVEAFGWIVEFNGESFDTYCSDICAV